MAAKGQELLFDDRNILYDSSHRKHKRENIYCCGVGMVTWPMKLNKKTMDACQTYFFGYSKLIRGINNDCRCKTCFADFFPTSQNLYARRPRFIYPFINTVHFPF